ncbi:MAG: archaemetzincin [Pyrinomonadaceae bacterium]
MPAKHVIFTKETGILFSVFFVCFAGQFFLTACTVKPERPASNMAAAREAKKERKELRDAIKKIEPFFEPMGKPEAYDWLGSHNEPGQTFDEYLDSDPTKPTKERQKIYVLPLGTFTPQQKKVIETASEYLSVFYDLPVEELPGKAIPQKLGAKDGRFNEYLKTRQIRTGFIMDSILKPALPKDAAALIAFTNEDLYPDATMSFVFGQASFADRVGVWSLRRLQIQADGEKFLQRTLKIAAHETGHMFSMWHCTKYECVMSGTNHIAETDRRPIDACPECMAKISWLSDITPEARYERLADFCRRNDLKDEAAEFDRKAAALKAPSR